MRARIRLTLGLALGLSTSGLRAQSTAAVDLDTVLSRAVAASPAVRVAEANAARVAALGVGADQPSRENPTLSVWSGPRRLADGSTLADLTFSLSWPIDLSATRPARLAAVDAQVVESLAARDLARLSARHEALAQWVRLAAAEARARLETERFELATRAQATAEHRASIGVTGAEEPTLARLLVSQAQGRIAAAGTEVEAARVGLRFALGLPWASALSAPEGLTLPAPAPLATLLGSLAQRPDLVRARAGVTSAQRDVSLQRALGRPVPRLGFGAGRENEYYARLGFDMPLPVYQRNQTGVAVAQAQVREREAEAEALQRRAEAALREAMARYEGALEAARRAQASMALARDVEQLSTRAFELGQRDLVSLLSVLRETFAVYEAALGASVAVAEARVALGVAAGEWP